MLWSDEKWSVQPVGQYHRFWARKWRYIMMDSLGLWYKYSSCKALFISLCFRKKQRCGNCKWCDANNSSQHVLKWPVVPFQGTYYLLPLITVSCPANCLVIFKQLASYPHTKVVLSHLSNFVGLVGLTDKYVFIPCDSWVSYFINRESYHRGITYIGFI